MRLLLVNQYYWPDGAATAQMLADIAEHAAGAGHHVTVLASRFSYSAPSGAALPRRQEHRGVEIRRVGVAGLGRGSIARRVGDYVSFLGLAAGSLLMGRRPDVYVSLTTPPMVGCVVGVVAALRRVPHVVWLMDVYPELAARFGVLRDGGLLHRACRAVMRRTLGAAAAVLALSEDMAASAVALGAPPARVAVAPNWADGQSITPVPPAASRVRRDLGIDPSVLVLGYSGNLGRAHPIDAVLEVMRRRSQDPRIHLLLSAGGPRVESVQRLVRAQGLRNVTFLPPVPREGLGDCLAASDVHLVAQDPRVDGMLVPSKIYGILAAGRSVIFLGSPSTHVGRLVLQGRCGAVVDPGDADGLDRVVEELLEQPDLRHAQGGAARRILEESFEMELGVRRLLDMVVRAGGRAQGSVAEPVADGVRTATDA